MNKQSTVTNAPRDYCNDISLEVDRKNTASRKWDDIQAVFGNKNILPMWIADMDFTAPSSVQAAIRLRAEHGVYGYAHKDEAFFDCIVEWQRRHHNSKISSDWITTTPGVVPAEAIAVLAFTNPGDEIIIQPPVYPPFFSVVEKNNRVLIENPLILDNGQYRMDFEDLEQKISSKTKLLIFCSPHNPSGRCWRREELMRLSEIIVRHNLIVVSDEIFADLVFYNHKHIPLNSINSEIAARTILCTAPSKTFNIAGLSTAYTIISNPALREQYRRQLAGLGLNEINNFGIAALTAAYTEGEEWLRTLLCYLEDNITELEQFVRTRIPQIKLIRPQATFLAWLDCNAISNDPETLQDFFVNRAGLGLNNGTAFGTQGTGFMRMNFACSRALLTEALERIENALR